PFNFVPQLIHLNKDHQYFEDGDICRHMYLQDLYISETDEKKSLSESEFACHIAGCCAVLSTLEEYEHHYNSLHRHVCCSCRRSFPSPRLLDIHIQEWHDSLFTLLAEKQDMVRLQGKAFHPLHLSGQRARKTVPHRRLTTILLPFQYQCLVEGCGQKFRTSQDRKDHLIRVHKYPPDFRFDRRKK
ncbi:unnamed protein product, partial [Tetraodon nigroviridis]